MQLTASEGRLREAGLQLGAMAPSWQEAQAARERLQEIIGELRIVENDSAARTRELERLDGELAEIATARLELEALAVELVPLATVADEFRRFEELAREEGRRQTLAETERALGEEIARLRERRDKNAKAPQQEEEVTEALEQKRRALEESLGQLEARRTEWVRDKQEAETKREALRRQYQELKVQREKVLELGEDGVCPTCTRVLGESFRTVLDGLDEQIETITVDGRYYGTRLEQLEQMPAEVRQLDERRRELQVEVGALERQLARVQAAVQEVTQLGRELATKEQRHETLQRDLAAIPTGYDAARHELLRAETGRLAPLNDRATRLEHPPRTRTAPDGEPRHRRRRGGAPARARRRAARGARGGRLLRAGLPRAARAAGAHAGRGARRRDRGRRGARRAAVRPRLAPAGRARAAGVRQGAGGAPRRCRVTSACTTNSIAPSPTCAPTSITSCAPSSPSWPAPSSAS